MSLPMISPRATEKWKLNDNRAFAAWALIVIAGSAALMIFLVLGLGATFPPLATLAEHVAMGLCVRAAYKSTGGWNWADWSIAGDLTGEARESEGTPLHPGAAAGALG